MGALLVCAPWALSCQFPDYTYEPPTVAGAAGSGAAGAGGGGSAGNAGGGAGGSAGGEAGTAGAPGGAGGEAGGAGGAPEEGCTGDEALCDDFEDRVAEGWTPSGGTWAVVHRDGNYAYQGGLASEESVSGDAAWADQVVEARMRMVSFGAQSSSYRAGIIARYASSSAFYAFAIGGDGNFTISKSSGAPSGALGTCGPVPAGVDPYDWFTLRMEVSGPAENVNILTFVNDLPVHDCTTTATTVSSGKIGVLTVGSGTAALFDDVRVLVP